MADGFENPSHMRKLILFFVAATAMAQVPDGDQHWAMRAEGHQGGHAQAAQVDAAIAAYRKAIAQNPNDIEARWKLLRAIRFKGAYAATTSEAKKSVYDEGRKAGEEALPLARGKTGPDAAEIYLWDAAIWGEWALASGSFAHGAVGPRRHELEALGERQPHVGPHRITKVCWASGRSSAPNRSRECAPCRCVTIGTGQCIDGVRSIPTAV